MPSPTITLDMDKRCNRCGRPGAAGNGLCLKCVIWAMRPAKDNHKDAGVTEIRRVAREAAAAPHKKARPHA